MIGILHDFLALIYPDICQSCGNTLFRHENTICTYCLFHLPKTNFHSQQNNPVEILFWGRAGIYSATACYYFHKGSKVQHLMHRFKYRNQKQIGVAIGYNYGKELKSSTYFNTVEVIIPVPLHPKKQKIRGYNQSEMFADGLAKALNIPVNNRILLRTFFSETQTRKSRFARWENVKAIFDVENEELSGKHLLLVDDVITTGATIEACVNSLNKIPGVKISIAAIAFASS